MPAKYLISVVSLLVLILLSGSARAFECPKHFRAAQAVIDKVTEDMEGMTDQMRGMDMGPVHAVLPRAKELLLEATRLHQLATAGCGRHLCGPAPREGRAIETAE